MEIKNEEYLSKLHEDILSIMDDIDNVCTQHNLKYYLIGGSLLGAVRHNGFIPWDDDLDIIMPREDFEKLVEIYQTSNDSDFYLRWITTESNYWQLFAKVCKKNTVFKEDSLDETVPSGIFVDIFPVDLCGNYNWWLNILRMSINQLRTLLCAGVMNKQRSDIKNRISKLIGSRNIHRCVNFIIKLGSLTGNTNYAMYGSGYHLKKQLFPKEWIGNGHRLPFESKSYKCPDQPSKVLQLTFGNTYMQLPPEDRRITHLPSVVKFSDGSVFHNA